MMDVLTLVATAVAGGLGAAARYAVTAGFARRSNSVPWGTLVVNTIGSAIGGVVIGLVPVGTEPSTWTSLVVLTGFCGGLTTFSTFTVDTVQLAERDENLLAANLNVLATLGLSIGAAAAAWALTRLIVG